MNSTQSFKTTHTSLLERQYFNFCRSATAISVSQRMGFFLLLFLAISANAQIQIKCLNPSCVWYTYPGDTIKIDVVLDSTAKYDLLPSFGCDPKVRDTITIAQIKANGNKIVISPLFNRACRQFGKEYNFDLDGRSSINIFWMQPSGIDDEYYANSSNISSTEYYDLTGKKIESPENHSGLLIVVKHYQNGKIKSSKEFRR